MSFSTAIETVSNSICDHLPDILMGTSIVTGVSATIYGIAVTPKAMDVIFEYVMENVPEEERQGLTLSELPRLLPFKIKVQLLWKMYLPVALGMATSIGTGIASEVMHDRREIAYAALATAAETRLKDIVESTKEVVGDKKYDEIEAKAAQKEIDRSKISGEVDNSNIYYVNRKTEGFPVIDSLAQRIFYIDRRDLDTISQRMNEMLRSYDEVTYEEFYREISYVTGYDIPLPYGGNYLIWSIEDGEWTIIKDMRAGLLEGVPCGILNIVHNLSIKDYEHRLVKINRYA